MKFLLVLIVSLISLSAIAAPIQTSDDLLKLLREFKATPEHVLNKSFFQKKCEREPLKNEPYLRAWKCKIKNSNIHTFGVFEYMLSGSVDFSQVMLEICESNDQKKRDECLLSFLKSFSKDKNKKFSEKNHSLEFDQENFHFKIGDITWGDKFTKNRIISIWIHPQGNDKGLGELGRSFLQLATMTGGVEKDAYVYLRRPDKLKAISPDFYAFINSQPKTEYEKKLQGIWNNSNKFWEDVVSKIGR